MTLNEAKAYKAEAGDSEEEEFSLSPVFSQSAQLTPTQVATPLSQARTQTVDHFPPPQQHSQTFPIPPSTHAFGGGQYAHSGRYSNVYSQPKMNLQSEFSNNPFERYGAPNFNNNNNSANAFRPIPAGLGVNWNHLRQQKHQHSHDPDVNLNMMRFTQMHQDDCNAPGSHPNDVDAGVKIDPVWQGEMVCLCAGAVDFF